MWKFAGMSDMNWQHRTSASASTGCMLTTSLFLLPGSIAGIVGVAAVGYVIEMTGSFSAIFKLTAAMYIVGALVWNVLCRTDVEFD